MKPSLNFDISAAIGLPFAVNYKMRKSHCLLIQAIYYFVSGLWPLLDIDSFIRITGPKTDIWLVKMVGLLTMAIAITLFSGNHKVTTTTIILSIASASAYLLIDVYYFIEGTISFVYLLDAVFEALIIISLLSTKK